ncbi:uncharacterized protein NPIL_500241 [Nephila pilipes]|uniref:Uncharacterized protein n=1 Tax=Nephila pilipes TaxID=299642 RepID=A0A8X6PJ86_NEPPI|nr:uncharacterized protein NPIL_500241 [Nephila pilipes]
MATGRYLFATLIICVAFNFAAADDSKEVEDAKSSLGDLSDTVGESMKGMTNFFKGIADGAKEKSEDGVEALKGFSSAAKEMSEEGAEKAKGWAEGIGGTFSKGMEKISETGSKMKEAVGDAMLNTKDEFETAASKLTKHAKDASDTVFKMFG